MKFQTTTVYLAGSSRELDRAERCAEMLASAGMRVTSTWMQNVRHVGLGNPRDASDFDRTKWSSSCLAELESSDAVVVLVPPRGSESIGAWVEAGYARALAKPLVFVGDTKQSVFCALGIECDSDESAAGVVLRLLGGCK